MWTSWPRLLRRLLLAPLARCTSPNRWLKLSVLCVEIVEGTAEERREEKRDVREAL